MSQTLYRWEIRVRMTFKDENLNLVSNNAYTFYVFDHLFHYAWLIFKGNEFDVIGAFGSL